MDDNHRRGHEKQGSESGKRSRFHPRDALSKAFGRKGENCSSLILIKGSLLASDIEKPKQPDGSRSSDLSSAGAHSRQATGSQKAIAPRGHQTDLKNDDEDVEYTIESFDVLSASNQLQWKLKELTVQQLEEVIQLASKHSWNKEKAIWERIRSEVKALNVKDEEFSREMRQKRLEALTSVRDRLIKQTESLPDEQLTNKLKNIQEEVTALEGTEDVMSVFREFYPKKVQD